MVIPMIDQDKKRFSGLCVGGQLDGQMLEHDRDYYRVNIELDPRHKSYRYGGMALPATYEIKVYKFTTGLRGGFPIDFWLYDNMTIEEAFTKIMTTYMKAVRKN